MRVKAHKKRTKRGYKAVRAHARKGRARKGLKRKVGRKVLL